MEHFQADFKYFIYLPDLKMSGKKSQTSPLAILDDSRYVHAHIYWNEKLPRLEDSLKKAILRHGILDLLLLQRLGFLPSPFGANLRKSRNLPLARKPYRPQVRWKVERLFQFVDSSFCHEVRRLKTGD
ncbi:hypothetical protein ACE41H_15295 [Paenibacillus enshidis]|uniref:Transposase DDE domain-containing protein n=1 Tax=Paenibacillus enshidis TaxID=1458439 RepID=A0ABV5AV86_9BACL